MTNTNHHKSNRRTALKSVLLSVLYPSILQKTGFSQPFPKQVIVIGAGISGLSAASLLHQSGVKTTVVEGRERIGGRIWTDTSLGLPLDLGASWIQGINGNPIAELSRTFSIQTKVSEYEEIIAFDHRYQLLSDEQIGKKESESNEILESVYDLAEELDDDISLAQALRIVLRNTSLPPEQQYALNWKIAEIEADNAADFDDTSLFGDDLQEEIYDGNYVLFPQGYKQIVDGLARDLDIRTNHIVESVQQTDQGITVITNQETFQGDYVIITVPLGVLQANAIKFDPPLPNDKLNAIQTLKMGVLNKVAIKFPRIFWDKEPDFIEHLPEQHGFYTSFLNWAHYTDAPVLMAFTAGSFAQSLESKPLSTVQNEIMGVLKGMYGNSIPNPDSMKVTTWKADPFSFGSYSYFPVSAEGEAYDIIAKPFQRILFAGEASFRREPATVHGAYLSGIREAERLIGQQTSIKNYKKY
jgi:monoamine oxidase